MVCILMVLIIIIIYIVTKNYLIDYRKVCLKEVIGQGGYGTVYKANWRGLVVAAKVIPLPAVSADSNNVKSEIEFLK